MQNKIARRIAWMVLALMILVIGRLWSGHFKTNAVAQTSANASEERVSPPTVSAHRVASTAAPAASSTSPGPWTVARAAPVQIDVQGPSTARVGESFETVVRLDASSGVRQLAFSVSYNKRVLQLIGSSAGTLVQQAGTAARFDAEEPSDGNVLVNVDLDGGSVIAGTGSVVVLQFQALKAGDSPVTIHSVTFADGSSVAPSTTVSVNEGAAITVN